MKKFKGLSLLLALVLLFQCLAMGVLATEAEQTPTETEPTAAAATEAPTAAPTAPPTEPPTEDPDAIPEVPFGKDAGVEYGCRSLDAAIPLVSDQKVLRSAKSVFVYERNSDTALYGYHADERLAPGGLVQILAALVVAEHASLDQKITVSSLYINQLPAGVRHQDLKDGEQISIRDLLYCLILTSANDAAVVLAQHVAGSPDDFLAMMNDKAAALGCVNTVVKSISGLDTAGQYTSARDMARILATAMENKQLAKILGTGTYTVPATNLSAARELKAMNYLLEGASVDDYYDDRVTGGKASFTSNAAGATIAFTAENETLDLVCVIIGATRKYNADNTIAHYGNFEEAQDLMDYCFQEFRLSRMLYRGQSMQQLAVEDGINDVVAVNRTDLDIVLPKDVGFEDLKLKYEMMDGKLAAPVEQNQQIATLQLWYKGSCVGETTLYAKTAVASQENPGFVIQDGASRTDEDMAKMLMYVGLVLLVLTSLAGIYLTINSIRRAAARKRARRIARQRRDERMKRRRRR